MARLAIPPGQDPIPGAHTSVPAAGSVDRPVKTMSRNTVPDMNTSTAGPPAPRMSASGSHQTVACGAAGPRPAPDPGLDPGLDPAAPHETVWCLDSAS